MTQHRIEEIIEPILISLLIGGNHDLSAKEFILQKLKYTQEHGLDAVSWKTFIPDDIMPEKRTIEGLKTLDFNKPSMSTQSPYSTCLRTGIAKDNLS